ncbi:MAG: hypothetical protein WD939_09240 [Dehalococcoidia bacterium]
MAVEQGSFNASTTSMKQPLRGLLITADPALARAFRRELLECAECAIGFDVQSSFDEAQRGGRATYDCVTVDMDGSIAPPEAVRLAHAYWPEARVALLACWWSERDSAARHQADVVIHKPLRSAELRAFLRSPTGPPSAVAVPAQTPDDAAVRSA